MKIKTPSGRKVHEVDWQQNWVYHLMCGRQVIVAQAKETDEAVTCQGCLAAKERRTE